MGLVKKLFILCILILAGSILIRKFMSFGEISEENAIIMMKFFDIIDKIDLFGKSIGIKGFQRITESGLSHLQFYLMNSSGLNVEQRQFDGVDVIIFDPIKHDSGRGAIFHYHGGGFARFNPKFFAAYLAELARKLNVLIVSVNYRKSPEHPFPIGINDALRATKYFLNHVEKFDVDPERIALMGESAGGNFAFAIGFQLAELKHRGEILRTPRIIIPIIPTLQMFDLNTPSYRGDYSNYLSKENCLKFVCWYAFGEMSESELKKCMDQVGSNRHLDQTTIERIKPNVDWSKYLMSEEYAKVAKSSFSPSDNWLSMKLSQLSVDPLFSPLSALSDSDLAKLPPVYFIVALRDPLRDDARMMESRLLSIGHPVMIKEYDQYHGQFFTGGFGSEQFTDMSHYLHGILKQNKII